MGGHDEEPVHPGGLNLFHIPKAAAAPKPPRLPAPAKINAAIEKDESTPVSKMPAMRAMTNALRSASRLAGKPPSAVLADLVKVVKIAGPGATTTQVARALDVDSEPWLDADVHPILLLRDLTRTYGKDWLSWEPETIWSEVKDDESLKEEIPRVNKDKVMAVRTAVKTDLPWKHLAVFENVALAFAGLVPRFDVMQPLEPYQIALGVDVLYQIHPGIDYDYDVRGYIAALLVHDGMSWAPPELFGDVEPMMKGLRPNDEVADKVAAAWKDGSRPDEATAVGSQVATLVAIREYLEGMNEQLALTLPLPAQEYDAETDPTMPSLPQPGISAPATGGA
jgi:hypothetical protein